MATTVNYKGSVLTTVENQTKTLKTAGKYMEGDLTIVDSGGGGGPYVLLYRRGYERGTTVVPDFTLEYGGVSTTVVPGYSMEFEPGQLLTVRKTASNGSPTVLVNSIEVASSENKGTVVYSYPLPSTSVFIDMYVDANSTSPRINIIDNVDRNIMNATVQKTPLIYAENSYAQAIGGSIYNGCGTIRYVSFPEVTRIEQYAFYNCGDLCTVEFPKVSYMGLQAFGTCSRLYTASFPLATTVQGFNNCSSLYSIYCPEATLVSGFNNCKSLKSFDGPKVTSIWSSTFVGCSNLSDISFPNVSIIGASAFISTKVKSAIFDNIYSIGSAAFSSCSSLTTVHLESTGSINLANYAFGYCSSLASIFISAPTNYALKSTYVFAGTRIDHVGSDNFKWTLSNGGTIGNYAFNNCSYLKYFDVSGIYGIGILAFGACTRLSSVSFEGLSYVYASAFVNCVVLSTAIFGETYCSGGVISAQAFLSCKRLLSLYLLCSSSVVLLSNVNAFNNTPISSYLTLTGTYGSVFVPEVLYNDYITATNWATYSSRIASLTDAQIQNVLQYGTHNPT